MQRPRSTLFLMLLSFTLIACGGDNVDSRSTPEILIMKNPSQVKVFKSDESIQCENEGVPLGEVRLELARAGIDVICAQKGHDGFAQPAVCGAGSGSLNIFVIHASNLEDAAKLGFKPTSELPEYQDQPCVN